MKVETIKIPKHARNAMEEWITLEELHSTAIVMSKEVLGKDGILVEFFLALWDDVGLILLEV